MSTLKLHPRKKPFVASLLNGLRDQVFKIPSFTVGEGLLFCYLTHPTSETLGYSNDDINRQPGMALGGRNEAKPDSKTDKHENT